MKRPRDQQEHFYDPNDHIPEGATKVPLVMPGQKIDMIVAGPADSLPQIVSTNPLVVSLPASKEQEMKYKAMLQGVKEQGSQNIHQAEQTHAKAEFAPKNSSVEYLHPPAEFAKKTETLADGKDGPTEVFVAQGTNSAPKSVTINIPKKDAPLRSSRLETALQEESKGSKAAPLHASKLEKSLKNMEGIAKMTGNKNGLMTKVEKQDDFLTKPKLSNIKEANSVTVTIGKSAVKEDKGKVVKAEAVAAPTKVTAQAKPAAAQQAVPSVFEDKISNHLHVPKKSESQKAIDKAADEAAAAKKKANHQQNRARHDYLGSDQQPAIFVNRHEAPVAPETKSQNDTMTQKPEGQKDMDLYVAAQKAKVPHPKQATMAAVQINNKASSNADEQEREEGQQRVVVTMKIQSQAELEAFQQ